MCRKWFLGILAVCVFWPGSVLVSAEAFPESPHPYENSCDKTWSYTYPGEADYLKICFSGDTQTEANFDIITITDGQDKAYTYSGADLAGEDVIVQGNHFSINLKSDSSVNAYGFAITDIRPATKEEFEQPVFTLNGGTITSYRGGVSDLVVPETIRGVRVTAIGYNAFARNTSLVHVTLPDTITAIESGAFAECEALESINIPEGLTSIEATTFARCLSLKSINIPETVTAIGIQAFWGCEKLESIVIPEGVTAISEGAFYGCTALTHVTMSAAGTVLDDFAFYGCDNLEEIGGPILSMADYSLPEEGPLRSVEFADSMTALSDLCISRLQKLMYVVCRVGESSAVYPQLKENSVCYIVRETGETNQGSLPTDTIRGKAEEIIRTVIADGMSDYDKALALHDWLCANAAYDNTFTNYEADGVLLKGTGVCQSYTLAYQLLLNMVGIENDTETGDDHIWNMICLDGDWYHVDVTWDDQEEGWEYDFFCVTNEALSGIESHECYEKPHIADSYRYNYFYVNGWLDDSVSSMSRFLSSRLSHGEGSFAGSMAIDVYDRLGKWVFYDYFGTAGAMAVRVLRDQLFTWNGHPLSLSISFNKEDRSVPVCVRMEEPDYVLPGALAEIGEEAFCHAPMEALILPGNVSRIGERAFADCDSLWQIYIPSSCADIADTAFDGSQVMIFCESGSAAETFAREHNMACTVSYTRE